MVKTYVIDTNVLIQAPYAMQCFEENQVVPCLWWSWRNWTDLKKRTESGEQMPEGRSVFWKNCAGGAIFCRECRWTTRIFACGSELRGRGTAGKPAGRQGGQPDPESLPRDRTGRDACRIGDQRPGAADQSADHGSGSAGFQHGTGDPGRGAVLRPDSVLCAGRAV